MSFILMFFSNGILNDVIKDMAAKMETYDPSFEKAIFRLTMIIGVQFMMKMLLYY